jgi:hypothetical protein
MKLFVWLWETVHFDADDISCILTRSRSEFTPPILIDTCHEQVQLMGDPE